MEDENSCDGDDEYEVDADINSIPGSSGYQSPQTSQRQIETIETAEVSRREEVTESRATNMWRRVWEYINPVHLYLTISDFIDDYITFIPQMRHTNLGIYSLGFFLLMACVVNVFFWVFWITLYCIYRPPVESYLAKTVLSNAPVLKSFPFPE